MEVLNQTEEAKIFIPEGETWAIDELLRRSKVVSLTDGATVALDARQGGIFTLVAADNRTIGVPTGKKDGWKIIIRHFASGADRTLSLTTGSAGAFRFGTTVASLSATTSGKSDYIGCVYNATDDRWDVVAVSKGY